MRNLFTTEPQRAQRNPTLTPTLSLRARERGERGENNIIPFMLSLSKHLLTLCTVLIISACGGGGGGGGNSPTGPSTTVAFSGSSSGYNVYMARNSSLSGGSVLAIDIKVDSVNNVFGAAFDIDFDSTKMTYSGYSAGSFLETGGNSVTYIATQAANKLIVGVSRQAPSGGQSGSGTLVTLKFNVASDASVSFSNNSLKDSSGNTISAVWNGGTVTVQ